jgi:hypothetical protein
VLFFGAHPGNFQAQDYLKSVPELDELTRQYSAPYPAALVELDPTLSAQRLEVEVEANHRCLLGAVAVVAYRFRAFPNPLGHVISSRTSLMCAR